MGLLTFGINVTLDGCVDHHEGIVDDETHAFFTRLMDVTARNPPRRAGDAPLPGGDAVTVKNVSNIAASVQSAFPLAVPISLVAPLLTE